MPFIQINIDGTDYELVAIPKKQHTPSDSFNDDLTVWREGKQPNEQSKGWEVLKLVSHGGQLRKLINGLYKMNYDGTGFDLDYLLKRNDTTIISVKRLSDGEILFVGRKDINYGKPCEILSFRVMESGCMYCNVGFENGNQQHDVNILSLDITEEQPTQYEKKYTEKEMLDAEERWYNIGKGVAYQNSPSFSDYKNNLEDKNLKQ